MSAVAQPGSSKASGAAVRGWRSLFYELRTEAEGRDAASVGVGVFIGCLPVYGAHLLLVFVFGYLLRLNRVRMYLAANISNPLIAPLLIFLELEVGAWARRDNLQGLTLHALRAMSPWTFGADLLVGSLVVGSTLGLAIALFTHLVTTRIQQAPAAFAEVARGAADRYLETSITAWEFARAKLLSDPVYESAAYAGLLGSGRTLLDVGCGQGLMLALLAEIRERAALLPAGHTMPVFDRLTGIELRHRVTRIARTSLHGDATIVEADVREWVAEPVSAVLLFDVLHMMNAAEQEQVIGRLALALEPGGTMLVRDVDASQGSRFLLVHLGNRLKAIVSGRWRQQFAFRTATEWRRVFSAHGFRVLTVPMSRGTPFANVLFLLRKTADPGQDGYHRT